MWKSLVTLPLQLVCQLVIPGNQNGTGNSHFDVETQLLVTPTIPPDYALRTPKRSDLLPEGYIAFPDIGVAYKYYTDELTWNSARKVCIEDGGTLAEIDTSEKIGYALKMKNYDGFGLAVGIHRLFDDDKWTSLKTGLEVKTIPWATVSYDDLKDRNCMAMYYDGRGLNAGFCNTAISPFICEIPLPD